jgi:multiple sugar transport system substrate-binding protein
LVARATLCLALVTACSGGAATPSPSTLTLGSNYSDEVPKAALQKTIDGFSASSSIAVTVNTVAPQQFQERISAYLQAAPDDVFSWFAGNRMRFFAEQKLLGDASAAWQSVDTHYSAGIKLASTGSDGKQYLMPFITYPWAVMYRKSVWQQHGYAQPATYDDLLALAERMKTDGLVPIAFGDRDGWPAMGYFDILDLRLNGYEFHGRLLNGLEKWTDQRVVAVFEKWRTLLPYLQPGALGRTWQEAAQSMINGGAGMIYLGTFAAEQAAAADRNDLDIFAFPLLGTAYDSETAIEAPINGFMMSAKPANAAGARAFLEYVGAPAAQLTYVAANPSRIAAAIDADTSGYTPLQQRMSAMIAAAGRVAQFFDRDTRPDFAGANGMQSYLQDFLNDPNQDLAPYLAQVQRFWDSLP